VALNFHPTVALELEDGLKGLADGRRNGDVAPSGRMVDPHPHLSVSQSVSHA
jgi:hypothetical protein